MCHNNYQEVEFIHAASTVHDYDVEIQIRILLSKWYVILWLCELNNDQRMDLGSCGVHVGFGY